MPAENMKAVVLRLDTSTIAEIDEIRQHLCGIADRSAWLRKAVKRSIDYDRYFLSKQTIQVEPGTEDEHVHAR